MPKFLSKEFLVIEFIVRLAETIFVGIPTPARLFARTAFGTAFGAGGNFCAADRAVEVFLRFLSSGHGY